MGNLQARFQDWFNKRLPYFWHNWICAVGSVLVFTSGVLLVLFLLLFVYNQALQRHTNAYVDLIAFLVLPSFVIMGVILLLIGNAVHRSRVAQGETVTSTPQLGGEALLRKSALVAGLTFVFIVGFGTFSYEAYHFTDSNKFCSTVCHEVMSPEATVYAISPHSKVACVKCHIGPGASWFVKAKLSGLRQVVAVIRNSYHRPIAVPVENLRPARETCEVCHMPDKFHGSRLVVRRHFEPDRDNSETYTANVVYIGGPDDSGPGSSGVHWHVDPANLVRYRHTDKKRQDIVEVIQETPEGEVRYLKGGAEDGGTEGEWRTMDCLDCHNRPTHIYEEPEAAVDKVMAAGKLDPGIPWLRRESVRALREVVPGDHTADALAAHLRGVYQAEHPEDLDALEGGLDQAAAELAAILERNVWPAMNITWGTYPTNLSHFDGLDEFGTGGCFRCHNDELEAADGRYIEQDCEKCHNLLAYRESDWTGLGGVDMEVFLTK